VPIIEVLERRDSEHFAIDAIAEERHCGVDQRLHVERVDLLGLGVRPCVREMTLQELAHVVGSRVVN
jgi:hypothetical protein